MGHTIQYESLTNELSAIYLMEYQEECLEYWDQPPFIKLNYISKGGKTLGVMHTPDFFVLRHDRAGWEEWKSEEELPMLAEKMPARYVRNRDGAWSCPPGEKYAQQFGLYYRIRTSAEINWALQRNLRFLEDYLRVDDGRLLISDQAKQSVISVVTSRPGITLSELFGCVKAARDEIYLLLITDEIFIDLSAAPLIEAERVCVFPDHSTALAYSQMTEFRPSSPADEVTIFNLTEGMALSWDGKHWQLINIGRSTVSLLDKDGKCRELPLSVVDDLIKRGSLQTAVPKPGQVDQLQTTEIIGRAGPNALREASRRFRLIEPYLNDSLPVGLPSPTRTQRRWIQHYRMARAIHGVGFLGLLPGARGNTKPKLSELVRDHLNKFIEDHYDTLKQKGKFAVYGQYLLDCERQCIQAVSYKTFAAAIHRRPKYEQTLRRQGPRAAYAHEPFYYELSPTVPRHGDRPFEIAHIDHTELDIELICERPYRNLGRPWATFLTDAFSRRLLAVLLLYDPPSYRTNMMVLRECVRRHHRFPNTIVVDGGKDFHSLYFDALLAAQECAKRTRPGSKPRFGSVIERLFGVTNQQFIHNLQGNTQITKNVRQVTKAIAPVNQAIWTLPLLYQRLCEWAYEIYDTSLHGRLEQSPQAAFENGMRTAGDRLHRIMRYDSFFHLLTLPTTRNGTAKVIPNNGVKINSRFYWSNAFRNPEVEKTNVPVRYDPYDAGQAYAFIKGNWVLCHSEHYRAFQGRTEREVMLASSELRKLHSRPDGIFKASAKKLASFLTSVEAQETLLMQRLRDSESKKVLTVIELNKELKPDLHEPDIENTDFQAQPEEFPHTDVHPRPQQIDEPELYSDY